MQAAFAYVAHGGVMVSVVQDDITFSDSEFHKREMMVIGSRNAARSISSVIASIRADEIPIDPLVTHRTTLRRSPRDIALGRVRIRFDQGHDRRPRRKLKVARVRSAVA